MPGSPVSREAVVEVLQLLVSTPSVNPTLAPDEAMNEDNIARVAIQALAAVLGGTQSLHCNGRDEALGLPTEESATIALRTQQILLHETGVASTVDPCGGAYAIEERTSAIERDALRILERIDAAGGTLSAIETGMIQHEIQESSYRAQQALERQTDIYKVTQKVLDALTEPLRVLDRELHVTASLGVSVFPHNGADADTLISNADVAMYRAKALGGNTYQFFTEYGAFSDFLELTNVPVLTLPDILAPLAQCNRFDDFGGSLGDVCTLSSTPGRMVPRQWHSTSISAASSAKRPATGSSATSRITRLSSTSIGGRPAGRATISSTKPSRVSTRRRDCG